jgi:Arc/MetJ family transcription regulator
MQDLYELAAERAEVPWEIRASVLKEVREATGEALATELAERMHEAVMARIEWDASP